MSIQLCLTLCNTPFVTGIPVTSCDNPWHTVTSHAQVRINKWKAVTSQTGKFLNFLRETRDMLWHFNFYVTACHEFPLENLKIFPFGFSYLFIYWSLLGHGLSRYVTGCHSLSREFPWQRGCYKASNITVR
jgi:hypothetical protein